RDAGNAGGAQVDAILMQDQIRRRPIAVGNERDLRRDRLVEEPPVALGKDFELRLTGQLREQPVAFASDGEDGAGPALIEAGIAIKLMGIARNRRARPLLLRAPAVDLVRPRLGHPGPDLVYPGRRELAAVLVQDERGRSTIAFGNEGDLRADEL